MKRFAAGRFLFFAFTDLALAAGPKLLKAKLIDGEIKDPSKVLLAVIAGLTEARSRAHRSDQGTGGGEKAMIDLKSIRARSVYFSRAVRWTWSDVVLRVALIAVLAGVVSLGALPALASPPANDDCEGAIVIPAGPYPVVTTPVDITQATPSGSADPVISCSTTDRTIWYSFTPSVTAKYVISTCAGSGATGSTVYDSVLGVFDSTGAACPQGASLGCNDTDPACSSAIFGAPYVDQSTVTADLAAGQTYYVVAGHWTGDAGGVTPAHSQIAIAVDIVPPPANDTCSAPVPLQLDRVTTGTTVAAHDDYQSPNTTACFAGVGQTPTSSPGADVVFSFTAPGAGSYSFRYVQDNSSAALRSQNPVLYAAGTCPPSGTVSCLKGANRELVNGAANGNRSEEIDCLPLTASQTVYVFFDDGASGNAGGSMAIEVHACNAETELNDTTAAANAYSACFMSGATNPTGDVDFFDLGAPPAGSKVFAAIDAVASNNSDYELRITTSTDTLQYDDNDGSTQIGTNSAVIAGTPTTGSQTFIRVNHKAAGSPAEPYHLYARVETGSPQLEVDTPRNDSSQTSNLITGGGFVSGVLSASDDLDCFRFLAMEGDDIGMFANNNPSRAAGTIVDSLPALVDLIGAPPTNLGFPGGVLRNILTPSPGTLTGTTPSITSNFWDYRARYTGTYFVCYFPNNSFSTNFPRPYEGSISLNCGPIPAPASHVTDVAVAVAGPAGPVNTGGFVDYTITLNNTGADYAQDVRLVDTLPTQMVFLGVTIDDGYSGQNSGCNPPPTPGTAGATIDCTNFSLAPGVSTTITIHTQVGNCSAVGANVHNVVSITTASTDPNPANDTASRDFTTSTDGTCDVLACDDGGCISSLCALGDHCVGSVCVSTPVDCDDGNACTDDACVPATAACVHASDDNNACGDGNACTSLDTCRAGACVGDALDCNVYCPPGFDSVAGLCQATYDIDVSLLDNLNVYCDGTGDNRSTGPTFDTACIVQPYGFHWTDLGGSLPAVASVEVQLAPGINCSPGGKAFTLNGVPAGSFDNNVGNCLCASPHTTVFLSGLNAGAYVRGGLNAISIAPSGQACEGLSRSANFGGNFGRVVVRYLPPAQPTDVCTAGACNPATGTCNYSRLANGSACSDGNACNGLESCQNLPLATCTPGTPVVCNDSNPCTDDSCNPISGCVHTNNTAPCDDGNSSTLGDTCGGGICHAGTNLAPGPKFLKAKLIDGDIKDPSKVILVNLDGDGRPDLLAAIRGDGTPGSSRIIWRRNLGKAGGDLVWGPQQIISMDPHIVGATGVAAADVDGDGLLDVVTSDRSATPFTDGKIAWYRNLGGGNFGDPASNQLSVSTTPPNQANAVQAADIDRDGRMDLVSASQTDSRIVWYQNLPASPARCGTANVGSGLRGWWPGDWFIADWVEGHRGAVDISGYGNNGNMYVVDFFPGIVGEGFKFYGTVENYIDQIGTPASYSFVQNTGVFTVAAWIKLQDANVLAMQPIMGNAQGGLVKGFLFAWENFLGEQKLRFLGFKDAPEYLDFHSPDQVLTDTNWHYVAVVGDGATVTFYVDGTAYPGIGTTGAPNPTGDSTALLTIGPSFGPGYVFNGMMDEVQIWDRALGAGEIQAIIAAGSKGTSTCNEPGGIKWVQHDIFNLTYYFPYGNTIHHTFRNVAVTDIDRDGDLDVVWASGPDAGNGSTWTPFAWLENTDGAGTFGPPNAVTAAVVDGRSAVTADIDGDGIEDVVSATCDTGLAWHHYDGSPAPGAFVDHTPFGPPTCTAAVAAADLDGDGKIDILSAGNAGATWYHQDPINLGVIPFQAIPLDGPASSAHDIHAVDLDGDGDLDILAAYDSTNRMVWFENPTVHSTAFFRPEHVVTNGLVPFSTAVAGDFDRDGHPDIVCGGDSGDLDLFQNRVTGLQWGSSWLEQGPYNGQSSSPSGRNLSVADLDRDGKLDIVYAGAGQPPLLFRGADRVGSQWPFTTIDSGITSTAAAVGDFDGDGDADVVVGVASGVNGVIHGYANIDGHGTLIPAFPDIPINSGASGVLNVPSVALGDLNGDGKPDLIAATLESPNAGRVCWFRGNGTSFDSIQTNLTPSAAVRSLAVGDLDGDGKLDVVMASSTGITWFHNAGDGIAGSLNPVASTSQPVDSIALADLDGDGDLDVVTASALDSTLGWYENIGGIGLFGARKPVVTSSQGSSSVAVADLDGDGTLDLLASSASPGARIAVYTNLRGQYSVSGTSIAPATAPSGQRVPLLAVTIRTHARPGDPACELLNIAFDMLANPSISSPLTGPEAATLFSGFELYRDANGSGSFDAGDLLISSAATAPSISFSPSSGDPEARLAAPATFLLVAQIASTAGNAPPTHFAAKFASADVVDTLPGALTPLTSTPQPALVTGLLAAQGAIHVDTTLDVLNAGDGLTSLREAIILANATPGGNQIYLPAGTFALGIAGKAEDGSLTGDLDFTDASGAVVITGVDPTQTIVDAGGLDRVFDILPGASAVFERLTMQGGVNPVSVGSGSGGALRVGTGSFATLTHCVVSGNTATQGGAIQNNGDLTVDGSSVSNNVATATGGGIVNTSVLRLRNALVSNNQSADHGGISNSGTLTVENSTLTGNAANLGGGGNDAGALGNSGTASLVSSTITGNLATVHGGVSTSGPGTTTLKSTILAGNQGSLAPDCNGAVLSQGYNLIGSTTGCTISNPGSFPDRLNVSAFLTPLQDNGGPTLTEMPLLGSPALDAGSCAGSSFTTDQRGFPRVVDQPSLVDISDGCDIGAVESPLTRTLTQISIPVRWCAVQGTPSIGSNQSLANSVLLSRTAKASKGIFEPEAGIKFVSGATPTVQNFFILPDPVISPGSAPGDVFIDPETRNFDEFTQLINACRNAWQAQDPSVVGVTAVHVNHFVDATGAPTDLLGLGGRADLGNSGEQSVAGRVMVIDSAYRASASPPDLVDRLLGHELGHAALALEHGNGIDDDHNGIVDDGDDARADLATFDGNNLMQYRSGTDLTEAQVLQGRLHALNTIPDLTVTTSVDSNSVPIDPGHAQILDFGHAQILDFGHAQILDFGQAQILDFGHAQILDFGHAQILDFGHAQILDFGMDVSNATSSNTTEFFTSVAGLPWPISVRTDTSYFYYLDLDNNDATGGKPSSFGFPPTGGAEDPGIDLIAKVVNSTNGNTLTVFKYVASTPNFVQVTVPCDPQTTVGCGFMEPISVGLYQDTGGAAPAHDDVVIGVNVKVNLPNTVLTDAAPAWTPGTKVGMETMTSVNCDQQVQAIDPNTGEPLVADCNRCSTLTCSTPGCEHAPGCTNGTGTPTTLADPTNLVVQNVSAQLAFVPPVLPHCVAAPGTVNPGGSVSVSGAGFPAGLAGQPVDLSLGATLLGVAALDGAGSFPATPITIPTTVTPSDVVLVATLHGKANSGDCKLEVRQLLITESLCALDTQTPTFTSVPAPVVVNTDPGVCTATLSLPAATATDNCDAAPAIISDAPAVFPLGLTTVTFTARDASGNIATATTTVTVNDHTAPTLTITDQAPQDAGANVVVTCTQLNLSGIGCARYDNSGIASWLSSASATDACSTATITNNVQGSSTFLRGLTTVVFTATDAAGNSTINTGVVRVIYNFGGFEPPLLSNGSAVITKGKQGRTIPVKFKLTCGGTPVTTAVATIAVHKLIDTATGTVDTTNLTDPGTSGDSGNLFHYDPSTQDYVFNLSTKPFSAPATYQIQVILDDGTDPVTYGHLVNFSVKP